MNLSNDSLTQITSICIKTHQLIFYQPVKQMLGSFISEYIKY